MPSTTPAIAGAFSLSHEDSALFARLSGDHNVLHVDPVWARRTQFGGTVVHGIHLLLRSLDQLAAQGLLARVEPSAVSATFHHPVPTGTTVRLDVGVHSSRLRISAATSTGQAAFTATVELAAPLEAKSMSEDAEFEATRAHEMEFPPTVIEGSVRLKLSGRLLAELFPALAHSGRGGWIADLLGTTQLVGMHCPGLHSIYSGLKLRRSSQPQPASGSMQYRVDGMDRRFRLLRVQVTGSCLSGAIEAFFRPPPVSQRPMLEVSELVSRGTFSGQRVLIVGGSRGLGELSAKILIAGGAAVTLTYARGKQDAERVRTELSDFGGACVAHHLDIAPGEHLARPEWLSEGQFSHVYYFASPPILRNTGAWDDALFRRFAGVYVAGFAELVERTRARATQAAPIRYLYPSSIFVTQPEPGFAEYAVAKAAGEVLCDQLQSRHAVRFEKPRLPRMRTDQTSALIDVGTADPLPLLLNVIRDLHS